jgi:hypothetical protein
MVKFLEEAIVGNLLHSAIGNEFLNMTPKAQITKVKINLSDHIKPKDF